MIQNMYFQNVETFIKYTKVDSYSFINYCELIIDKYGGVHTAVPSHEEKLIDMVSNELRIDKETIIKNYKESGLIVSPIEYLCSLIDAISVWYDKLYAPNINDIQDHVLRRLYEEGLIKIM